MTEQIVMPELDVFNLPVFPVADLFPMIAADELAELAEDIAENGLQEPVVIAEIAGQWQLVDGRNRLAACRLANIIPHTRILESDPTAYVLSANVHRRHLTKGQQAMAVALAYPESKRGRGNVDSAKSVLNTDISDSYLKHARFVLRHCRDKAEEVLRNADYPLTTAYVEAKEIVEAQQKAEDERKRLSDLLNEFRNDYPDLIALYDDKKLSIQDAIAAGDQRRETARLQREQERLEQERLADFASKVELVRQKAPDLADKMAKGKIDFEGAKMKLAERETAAKAQIESNLDAFYRFSELCQLYTSETALDSLRRLLVENGDQYRNRWRRTVQESLRNVQAMIDNKDNLISLIKDLS